MLYYKLTPIAQGQAYDKRLTKLAIVIHVKESGVSKQIHIESGF